MATLLITYNLNDNDNDYDKLFKAIEALGDTWHDAAKLDSVWFVKTTKTADQAHEALVTAMDRNDNDFIVDITGRDQQGWMPKTLWAWLKE